MGQRVLEDTICNVCGEVIAGEDYAECDPCMKPYHKDECGGFIIVYGMDTYACDKCREYRNE